MGQLVNRPLDMLRGQANDFRGPGHSLLKGHSSHHENGAQLLLSLDALHDHKSVVQSFRLLFLQLASGKDNYPLVFNYVLGLSVTRGLWLPLDSSVFKLRANAHYSQASSSLHLTTHPRQSLLFQNLPRNRKTQSSCGSPRAPNPLSLNCN